MTDKVTNLFKQEDNVQKVLDHLQKTHKENTFKTISFVCVDVDGHVHSGHSKQTAQNLLWAATWYMEDVKSHLKDEDVLP